MSKNQDNNKSYIMYTAIGLIIIAFAVIIWLLLNNGKETKNSEEISNKTSSSLLCTTKSVEDAFFVSKTAQHYEHEIKILYTDNKFTEMSYSYSTVYNSEKAAEDADAKMHADYNHYMYDNEMSPELFNPVFSPVKSKDKITLFVKEKNLNNVIAKILFLTLEDVEKVKQISPKELGDIYKEKGFSCEYRQ